MRLWNGSDEWEVQLLHRSRAQLRVIIRQDSRSAQIFLLRSLIPEMRNRRASSVHQELPHDGEFDLGEFDGGVALRMEHALSAAGMSPVRTEKSTVIFVPWNRTEGTGWEDEDETARHRIALEMISAGIPVVNVEA